jgi:hypothetical protein
LAAFSQFPERLNWKIMENGKRPLVISANVLDSSGPEALAGGLGRIGFQPSTSWSRTTRIKS